MKYIALIIIVLSFLLPCTSKADDALKINSSLEWNTIETEHFFVHFPSNYSEWSIQICQKLEGVYSDILDWIGYPEGPAKIDVIVNNPYAMSNGMAVPDFHHPRVVFWPVAPVSPMMFGTLSEWSDLLMTHEFGHIVHLTRPPRSLLSRIIASVLPLGPMALNSPMWLSEGTAVILESRLTGFGRAQSTYRASIIRQLALEGKLPGYGSLNGNDEWMSGAYPYLVGSAFMEWLEKRSEDPDCFRKLWRRMSARTHRSFEDAFSGVFQDTPEDLYDRFVAEITHSAMQVESSMDSSKVTEWHEVSGFAGNPDISPDGSSMVISYNAKPDQSELVVWDMTKREEAPKDIKVEDPEDVEALPWKSIKPLEIARFKTKYGFSPKGPRWYPDGRFVIVHGFLPDSKGEFHPDLFRWDTVSGNVTRLTWQADLRWAEVFSDQKYAVAIRQVNAKNSIVLVNLETGEAKDLLGPSLDKVWEPPRVSPDGRKFVTIERDSQGSFLIIMSKTGQELHRFPSSPGEIITTASWATDGNRIFASSDKSGIFNLIELSIESGETKLLTQLLSSAYSPEHYGETLFFLSFGAQGFKIRSLNPEDQSHEEMSYESVWPVLPGTKKPEVHQLRTESVGPAREYGFGPRQEFKITTGGKWMPCGWNIEAGIRGGDVLGRLVWLANSTYGDNGGTNGLSFHGKYSGSLVSFQGKLFFNRFQPEEQDEWKNTTQIIPDRNCLGVDFSSEFNHRWSLAKLSISAAAGWEKVSHLSEMDSVDRILGSVKCDTSTWFYLGRTQIGAEFSVLASFGHSQDSWSNLQGTGSIFCRLPSSKFQVYHTEGEVYDNPGIFDLYRIGGWSGSTESFWMSNSRYKIPYLPEGFLSGSRLRHSRVEFSIDGITFFGEQFRAWTPDQKVDDFRAAGIEICDSITSLKLLRFPSMEFIAGAAYMFDPPFEDDVNGYVGLRVYP